MATVELVSYTENSELELTWEVTYSIVGKNKPATFHNPAEYTEMEIEKIELKEAVYYILHEKKLLKGKVDITSLVKEDIDFLEEKTIDRDKLEVACWEDDESRWYHD